MTDWRVDEASMPASSELRKLLDRLCVELGFCFSPDRVEGLVNDPPREGRAFTDEVFRAEGLDPTTIDRRLYRQVRDVVLEVFGAAECEPS